jgi:hypothetical protein
MLAARAFMMLFLYNSATSKGVASSCKILPLSTDTASSNSCIPFTAMLILAEAFAVYSSCEIPLGLMYGINSTVLQCPKWILILSRYSK